MDPACSQFLARLLQELGPPSSSGMTFPDLCTSLCARFDLLHLVKLRSLLLHTASVDPAFPASLLQERLSRSSQDDPQQRKLAVAGDIVAVLNLIQTDGEEQAGDLGGSGCDQGHHHHHQRDEGPPQPPASCDCSQLLHSSDPNFLLKRGAPPEEQQPGGLNPPPDRSYRPPEALQQTAQPCRNLLKVSPQVGPPSRSSDVVEVVRFFLFFFFNYLFIYRIGPNIRRCFLH